MVWRAGLRYRMGMTNRPRSLPAVRRGQVLLLVAPRAFLCQALPPWIARLALNGPLRVLDGGGRFNPYSLGRPLRRLTPQVAEVMKRIHIQRAFTCYQMAALLDELCVDDDNAPFHSAPWKAQGRCSLRDDIPVGGTFGAAPVLALDLLNTFHDQDVPAHERRRLLAGGLARLNSLSKIVPVAISASLPEPSGQEDALTENGGMVWLAALEAGLENPHTWWFDKDTNPPPPHPRLFY